MQVLAIEKNTLKLPNIFNFAAPLLYRPLEEEERKFLKNNLNQYLWDQVKPYLKFVDVTKDNMMEIMCQDITKSYGESDTDKIHFDTDPSYHTSKVILELVFGFYNNIPTHKENDLNILGSYFSLKDTSVERSCYVLANKIIDGGVECTSVTQKHVLSVIRRRYYYSAVVISCDKMQKYYYQVPDQLAFHYFNTRDFKKIRFQMGKFQLVMYHIDSDGDHNEIASKMVNKTIKGDVIVIREKYDDVNYNLSLSELRSLVAAIK